MRGARALGALAVLVGCSSPARPVVPPVASVIAPTVATTPTEAPVTCGVERWSVKTLADASASRIDFRTRKSSVEMLRRLHAPRIARNTPRTAPERVVYEVAVRLVEAKSEDDGDIHLVIADGSTHHTMIVEFPNPSCVGTRHADEMARARRAFIDSCGPPSGSRFARLVGEATIRGVAFFDVLHGQTGVAPNGIELHPVLGFSARTCSRA